MNRYRLFFFVVVAIFFFFFSSFINIFTNQRNRQSAAAAFQSITDTQNIFERRRDVAGRENKGWDGWNDSTVEYWAGLHLDVSDCKKSALFELFSSAWRTARLSLRWWWWWWKGLGKKGCAVRNPILLIRHHDAFIDLIWLNVLPVNTPPTHSIHYAVYWWCTLVNGTPVPSNLLYCEYLIENGVAFIIKYTKS